MGLRGSIVAALAMLGVSLHQGYAQDAPVSLPCGPDCRLRLDGFLPVEGGAAADGEGSQSLVRHGKRASAERAERRRRAAARKRDAIGRERAATTGEAPAAAPPIAPPLPPAASPAPGEATAPAAQATPSPSSLPVLTAFAPELGVGPVFTGALPQATREAMSAADAGATTEGERILPEPQPWVGRTVSLPPL